MDNTMDYTMDYTMDIDNNLTISTSNFYEESNFFLKKVFIIVGVLFSGSYLAVVIIANLLFTNVEREYKKIYGYDSDQEDIFDIKYIDEYNNLEDKEIEDLTVFKDLIVYENTPDGFVILGYDTNKESFFYYSDYKNIKYYYLEVVARKFVVENNCKNLLINSYDELMKNLSIMINKKKEKRDKIETPSVFANFKSSEINKKKSIDYNLKMKDTELPVSEKSNNYIYMGSIDDYEKLYVREKDPSYKKMDTEEFENIDYNSFKNK